MILKETTLGEVSSDIQTGPFGSQLHQSDYSEIGIPVVIIWEELTMYAEVIDRFLLLDCKTLISDVSTFRTLRDGGADSILRLVALGLMIEDRSVTLSEARKSLKDDSRSASKISNDSKKKKYKRTDFGIKLANILR